MKHTFFITILFILLQSNSCKLAMDYKYEIDLINNSPNKIGYYFALGGKYGTYYPQGLPSSNQYIVYDMSKEIKSGVESSLPIDKFFDDLPKDTLSLYIFSTDTLNKYSWEVIKNQEKYIKRFDFSKSDLKKLKNKVVYPFGSELKDIKQFPAYGE